MKQKLLLTMCLLAISLIGCAPVQMRPGHERAFRLAAVKVDDFNNRCQNGDMEACKDGLNVMNDIMQEFVAAMEIQ